MDFLEQICDTAMAIGAAAFGSLTRRLCTETLLRALVYRGQALAFERDETRAHREARQPGDVVDVEPLHQESSVRLNGLAAEVER